MKVVGYCRVSTGAQRDEGTIDIQYETLQNYVEEKGYELIYPPGIIEKQADKFFNDDGIGGAKDLDYRPGLSGMFDFLETDKEVTHVLIYKLDRIARDLYIQEHLIAKLKALGKELISVTEPDICSTDPMRIAFRQFMGIFAQLEKSFITMRMTSGRTKKASKGGHAGGVPPYGYNSHEGELLINKEEEKIIKDIFRMKGRGFGLNQIARELTSANAPMPRTGKPGTWNKGTIKYILNNELYYGITKYGNISAERPDLKMLKKEAIYV